MDYASGTVIAKWQWDMIYDPAIVNGVFDEDSQAMAVSDVIDQISKFDYVYIKKCNEIISGGEVNAITEVYKFIGKLGESYTVSSCFAPKFSDFISKSSTQFSIPKTEEFILRFSNKKLISICAPINSYPNFCSESESKILADNAFLEKISSEFEKCNCQIVNNFSSIQLTEAQTSTLEKLFSGQYIINDPAAGTRHNLKAVLFITDATTSDAKKEFVSNYKPLNGEQKIWLNKTANGWERLSSLSEGEIKFKSYQTNNGNLMYDDAKFLALMANQGLDVVAQNVYEKSDYCSNMVRSIRIPEYAWDDQNPEYNPLYLYAYKFIVSPISPVFSVFTLSISGGFYNLIPDKSSNAATTIKQFGDRKIDFAFQCGVWNGAVETVATVPDIIKLIAGSFSSKGRADFEETYKKLNTFVLYDEAGKQIDSGIWCAITTGVTQQLSTALRISEFIGEIGFTVALCTIDPAALEAAGAKTISGIIRAMKVCDNAMDIALKPLGYAVRFVRTGANKTVAQVWKGSKKLISYADKRFTFQARKLGSTVEETIDLAENNIKKISETPDGKTIVETTDGTKLEVVESVNGVRNLPSVIRQLTTKPLYKPLRTVWSSANKTTSIIGKWEGELKVLFTELSKTTDLNIYMLTGKFDHPGGFNMLSIEDWGTKVILDAKAKGISTGTKAFDDFIWESYNKPWLENAMLRGDDIVIWSDPYNLPIKTFKDGIGKTFFEREIEFIKNNSSKYGYDYSKGISFGTFSK